MPRATTRPRVAMIEEMIVSPGSRRRTRRRRRVRQIGGMTPGYQMVSPVVPPVSAGVIVGSSNPVFRSGREGELRLQNVEFVTQVGTQATYTGASIRVAPFSFSWLNGISANFSKFRWVSVRFIYVPACPTTTSGQVAMALEYDVPDSIPTSLQAISPMKGFVTCPAWAGYEGADLLCDPNKPPRPGAIVTNVDVARFDKLWYPYITSADFTTTIGVLSQGGNIYVPATLVYAAMGGPATSVLGGNIFVQYDVELIEPIVSTLNY